MNQKQLNFILQAGEGLKTEFKEAFDPKNLAKEHAPFPKIDFSGSYFYTVFKPTIPYLELAKEEKFGEKFGESQIRVLKLIHENPNITIPDIANKLNFTTRGIEKNIAKLKKKGILKRAGPAKGGQWEVIQNE
ncbi:MAG: hypothetical protein CVU81_02555 [Euryarchaeota archaeon HGW-Euryarchaeota-1]|nr:MAG: hypothetical protein CVU81_02555 [Euryarchaeota archaeon HGW-Euryarchaeota-1]